MDETLIELLKAQNNNDALKKATAYYESMKLTETGWQICMQELCSGGRDSVPVKFYCFEVLQYYIQHRYRHAEEAEKQNMRRFLFQWIHMASVKDPPEDVALRNKCAQLVTMAFIQDFPDRWKSFFQDLLKLVNESVDMYLRILKEIDLEIVDREVCHTVEERRRNNLIKDAIRETCVEQLCSSWVHILNVYESSKPSLVCRCLEVIGAYALWVDINLITNEEMVSTLLRQLQLPLLKDSVADCICDIIRKKMLPLDRVHLIQNFITVLDESKILRIPQDEGNFAIKQGKLLNTFGMLLLESWQIFNKNQNPAGSSLALMTVESLREGLLCFLQSIFDDVSAEVLEFAREYLLALKHLQPLNQEQRNCVERMIYILIQKVKFDPDYNFEAEGEDEADFMEYSNFHAKITEGLFRMMFQSASCSFFPTRPLISSAKRRKQLRTLMTNIACLDKDLLSRKVEEYVTTVLRDWQGEYFQRFQDIEAAITLVYMLGDAILPYQNNQLFPDQNTESPLPVTLRLLINSNVSMHPHPSVQLQFLETVVRHEKLFSHEPHHIPSVLPAFLDDRGLRSNNKKLQSRAAYLLSRFIRSTKSHLHTYVEHILGRLGDLLALTNPDNGPSSQLSLDDQMYLYEVAGVLIVSGPYGSQEKANFMGRLVEPVLQTYKHCVQSYSTCSEDEVKEKLANTMVQAISVTTWTSKAFTSHVTIQSCGCQHIYLQALQVFLEALELSGIVPVVVGGIRQYLHRMVVCLEDELLLYIPASTRAMLLAKDCYSIAELLPLVNQIVAKFKKKVVPFLQEMFIPIHSTVMAALAQPVDPLDETAVREKQTVQRHYFMLIAGILENNLHEIFSNQDPQIMEHILLTVVQSSVESPDPVAQKTCFLILRRFVEAWGANGPEGFQAFLYNQVVPACFMAPMKYTFDLSDAQALRALQESAACLKSIHTAKGNEFILYLTSDYLPKMKVNGDVIQEYCGALVSSNKTFKDYIKIFFQRAKS